MSNETFPSHECDLPLKATKRIEVVYFRDDSYKNKKMMTGWGTDGILYTFEVVPRKPIPLMEPLSRRKVTDFRTDEDVPESALEFSEHQRTQFFNPTKQK